MGWRTYPIRLGDNYFDEWGRELIVTDFNFDLPEKHSWNRPPEPEEGYAVRLVGKEWQHFIDHREKTAFAKDRDSTEYTDYVIEELGELPATHTLKVPGTYDSWMSDKKVGNTM